MVLLINYDNGKHKNYYEGNHVGFHNEVKGDKKWLMVVIEGKEGSITVEICEGQSAKLYLMNNRGRTIETRYAPAPPVALAS